MHIKPQRLLSHLALLTCVLPAACASGDLANSCTPGPATSLAMTITDRSAIVDVTINQRRAHLLFDTGSDSTILSPGVAAVLGVKTVAAPLKISQGVGGRVISQSGMIDTLKLGDFTLSKVPVSITAITGYDGVLGLDVLSRYDVDVNLPQGAVTLHDGGACGDKLPPMGGAMLEVPAQRIGNNPTDKVRSFYLAVPVILDAAKTIGVFDTGAMASVVSNTFATKSGASAELLAADKKAIGTGFGTTTTMHIHRFGELAIGRELFTAPVMMVGGNDTLRFPVILGFDYFAKHRVWFNYAADRIFVVPVKAP